MLRAWLVWRVLFPLGLDPQLFVQPLLGSHHLQGRGLALQRHEWQSAHPLASGKQPPEGSTTQEKPGQSTGGFSSSPGQRKRQPQPSKVTRVTHAAHPRQSGGFKSALPEKGGRSREMPLIKELSRMLQQAASGLFPPSAQAASGLDSPWTAGKRSLPRICRSP